MYHLTFFLSIPDLPFSVNWMGLKLVAIPGSTHSVLLFVLECYPFIYFWLLFAYSEVSEHLF